MKGLSLWFAALAVATTTTAYAQRGNAPKRANSVALQQIATQADKEYQENYAKALILAKKHGWVIEKTYSDGTHMSLQGLDKRGLPVYYITYNNTRAAATTNTDQLWAGGSLGLNLSGAGSAVNNKLGIWDGGRVLETHQELKGRVVQKDKPTKVDGHATHVAGTMIASGVNALAKGMAFGTKTLMAYDFNNDITEMAAAASGLLVSNHSYGSLTGWRFNSDRKGTAEDPYWEWWGNPDISSTEDYRFGYYDESASKWDKIAFEAPYYLIVKSAGNSRGETGPEVGKPYYQRDSNGKFNLVSSRPASISSNNSYDIISTYGNAKNILLVGAVEPISTGYNQPSDVRISGFSSYGPTDDGRIKPDIVGNGVAVLSTSSESDRAYQSMSGTSMASPNVAGSMLLLQEHYSNLNNGNVMRAATLRGLAIHTASEAGTAPGPDYVYGWGLLNAGKAAALISNTNGTHLLQEKTLAQNEEYTLQVTASGAGPLVVTIAWTDPEATAVALNTNALDNPAPRLVNDLDVRISNSTTTFLPWILDPKNPANVASRGDNILDNVEQVLVENAIPGETYTIKVKHKGTLQRGPQAFSLLASGVGGTAYCTSAPNTDQGAFIDEFKVGDVAKWQWQAGTCTTYSNYTNHTYTFEPGQTKSVSISTGTCGTDAAKAPKVFIDWNGDGDFNDASETAATFSTLTGNADFTSSITAPATVEIGRTVRMRVVLAETANAGSITACGAYERGETQDYLVKFERPQKDVGVATIKLPTSALCATPNQPLSVLIRNFGTAAASNITVKVKVLRNGREVTTLSEQYKGTLAAFSQDELMFSNGFATEAGATYTLEAFTEFSGDAVPANNSTRQSITIAANAAAPQAAIYRCGSAGTYSLTGSGDGTIFWYTSATATQPIAAGNQLQLPLTISGGTLYASLNDFSATIGPATKGFATGGGYNQFTPDVLVTTNAPMLLESARLYIGNGGKITFTAYDQDGAPVSSRTLTVTPTRTIPGPKDQPDDPADQGAVYYLGLELPHAGNYKIAISYENGATIYRNNAGVTGYPFGIPNVFTITGNTATTTPEAYYYYFYDLKVSALGCKSERIPVTEKIGTPLQKPQITRSNLTLKSSAAEGNRWYLNGRLIQDATNQNYIPTQSGNYTVMVVKDGCISEMSTAYTFSFQQDGPEIGAELVVSPNPSTGRFKILLETSQPEDISVDVTDLMGNLIYTRYVKKFNGLYEGTLDLSSRASGIYLLRVRYGSTTYTQKLMVQH
ncbi:S8 family serine peptidase [Pontibacter vulgaris]|uniref:S8 family serine peptidase n=1 Tax=Pontibacter vulgaris TaxID=2905679 RepID=UPI001FA6B6FB|nr:S8 family serine peptidase [Pontibacter vulgaris]